MALCNTVYPTFTVNGTASSYLLNTANFAKYRCTHFANDSQLSQIWGYMRQKPIDEYLYIIIKHDRFEKNVIPYISFGVHIKSMTIWGPLVIFKLKIIQNKAFWNVKSLYRYSGKIEDKLQFKTTIDKAMLSTPSETPTKNTLNTMPWNQPNPSITLRVWKLGPVSSNHGNIFNKLIALIWGRYGILHAKVNNMRALLGDWNRTVIGWDRIR